MPGIFRWVEMIEPHTKWIKFLPSRSLQSCGGKGKQTEKSKELQKYVITV